MLIEIKWTCLDFSSLSPRWVRILSTGRDSPEPFLSRRVPNLQLDAFAIKLNGPDFEVYADCRNKRWCERVIGEAEQ